MCLDTLFMEPASGAPVHENSASIFRTTDVP
jgi:hypothetical protein